MNNTKISLLLFLALLPPLYFATFSSSADRINEDAYEQVSQLRFGDLSGGAVIASAFKGWLAAIKAGDEMEAFSERNRITTEMEQIGTRNLVPLADIAIVAGDEFINAKDYGAAFVAATTAVSFAPDYPRANFFLAYAQFMKDKGDINPVITSIVAGVKAIISDRIQVRLYVSSVAQYALIAFLVASMIIFATLALANANAIFAEIASVVPAANASIQRIILGVLAFAVPFALGGWLLFLLALPIFCWPHLKKTGKFLAILLGVIVIASPNIMDFMANGKMLVNADTYRALYLLSNKTWDQSTITILKAAEKKSPGDPTLTIALGLIYKHRGEKDAALDAYDAALARNETDLRALVNKGNVYFVSKDFSSAAAMYEKAIKTHPKSVEAHFNLSNTLFESYKTEESEAEYNEAQAIDPKLTARLVSKAEQGFEYKVTDYPINLKDLARFENALPEQVSAQAAALWATYFGGISKKAHQMVSIGYIAFIIVSSILWSKRIAHQHCATCGATFRPPVVLTNDIPKCNQCVAASLRTRGMSSATTDKKRKEMRNFQETRAKTASFIDRIIPGAGRIYFHESFGGVFFSFTTALFIVFGANVAMSELGGGGAMSQETLMRHVVFLVSVVVYWAIMNTALKKEIE